MKTVEDLTDFSKIEDVIAKFIETASGLPEIIGQSRTYWSGFDFARLRPYAVINPISQFTTGQPWIKREFVNDNFEYILSHPYILTYQASFYTDNYNPETREVIREDAKRYAQRLANRASVHIDILAKEEVVYIPENKSVNAFSLEEDDKYLKQANIELKFSGIAKTKITESDYFETIENPEIIYSGE